MIHQSLVVRSVLFAAVVMFGYSQARSLNNDFDELESVIPSPNQNFDDTDIRRTNADTPSKLSGQLLASSETGVPVYVSPFLRTERSAAAPSFEPQESSHAPPNYAPRPSASTKDLKTSASYGKYLLRNIINL